MTKNIKWHKTGINKKEREAVLKQKGVLLWLTGLSGSGKSTIATALQKKLIKHKKLTFLLDGDNIRHGLNKDLGFSKKDREENIRRIGEVAALFVDAGLITITSFISPYRKDRNKIRKLLGRDFIEVYVKCDIDICQERDPKRLYKKAKKGKIKQFTGITDPYEAPGKAEIVIDTEKLSAAKAVEQIIAYIKKKKVI